MNEANPESKPTSTEQNDEQSIDPTTEPSTPEDKIREHGRLFIRNLPFKTTEDALRERFSSFGPLEEVSLTFISIS